MSPSPASLPDLMLSLQKTQMPGIRVAATPPENETNLNSQGWLSIPGDSDSDANAKPVAQIINWEKVEMWGVSRRRKIYPCKPKSDSKQGSEFWFFKGFYLQIRGN